MKTRIFVITFIAVIILFNILIEKKHKATELSEKIELAGFDATSNDESMDENDYEICDSSIFDFEHLTFVDDNISNKTKLISDLTDSYNAYRLLHDMRSCYEDRYFGMEAFPENNVRLLPIKDLKLKKSAENYKNQMTKLLKNVCAEDSTEYEKIDRLHESFSKELFKITDQYAIFRSKEEFEQQSEKVSEEQVACVKLIDYHDFIENFETNPLQSLQSLQNLEEKLHHVTSFCEEAILRSLLVFYREHYPNIKGKSEYSSIEHLRILIDKNTYFPEIYQTYQMWRCLVQINCFAPSRWSEIPQAEYNAMRMKMANIVLKELSQNPNDPFVRDAFMCLATSKNFTRFGSFGNQAFDDIHDLFSPDFSFLKN